MIVLVVVGGGELVPDTSSSLKISNPAVIRIAKTKIDNSISD